VANFYVHDIASTVGAHIRGLIGAIGDRRMQDIQLKRLEGDQEYRKMMLQNDRILTAAKVSESRAKTRLDREKAADARKAAEGSLVLGLMKGISDVYQNGVRKGDVDPDGYEALASGSGNVMKNVARIARSLGVSDAVTAAFAQGGAESIVTVTGRRQMADQMAARNPKQFEAISRAVGGQENVYKQTPKQIQGMLSNMDDEAGIELSGMTSLLGMQQKTLANLKRTSPDSPMIAPLEMKIAELQTKIKRAELRRMQLNGSADAADAKKAANRAKIEEISRPGYAAREAQRSRVAREVAGGAAHNAIAPVVPEAAPAAAQAAPAPAATQAPAPAPAISVAFDHRPTMRWGSPPRRHIDTKIKNFLDGVIKKASSVERQEFPSEEELQDRDFWKSRM